MSAVLASRLRMVPLSHRDLDEILAIENGVELQKLDYAKLKEKLLADGQMLMAGAVRAEESSGGEPTPMVKRFSSEPAAT